MSVDGAVVTKTEVLEDDTGEDEMFNAFLGFAGKVEGTFSADHGDEFGGLLVEMSEGGVGGDFIEVTGDGTDVFGDGPFVVVEDDDETFGLLGDVIEGFEADSAGKSGIASDGNDVFLRPAHIASDSHAEGGGKGGAGVTCAVGVVRAFAAEKKAVEACVLPDGVDAVAASGQQFMDVALVGNVEDKFIVGSGENAVKSDGELDHAEVGAEVTAGL